MNRRQIYSVGIDIGTTTTQVIFSLLELVNRAGVSQVPRYEFSRREIVYQSPVSFTPLDADGRVNEAPLMAFIRDQYLAAGIEMSKIESGAIIITGETSKARNAREAIMRLSETLGDFVVATAGPHLESAIAGYGSGACELSEREAARVVNIDIGGGTANYAVFEAGRLLETACLNVGGRLIEVGREGNTRRVHAPAHAICTELFGAGYQPDRLGPVEHGQVAARMAELLWEVLQGCPSPLAHELLMTQSLRTGRPFDAVLISGGVGECYYHPTVTPYAFGDIGPLLAQAIAHHQGMQALRMRAPAQTVRATVIGAGAYTLSLSGSTIWLHDLHLPQRNIPVAHPDLAWANCTPGRLVASLEQAVRRLDLDPAQDLYALALPTDLPVAYRAIEACVNELAGFSQRFPQSRPLLVLSSQDLGKALGMLLQPALAGRQLAVIDEVATRAGDYIDIGMPLFGGDIVPITVKSLAFPSSKGV